ncbi:MAG: hypothetical protein LBT91_01240, partial [Bifidobacteriaceae bacterium]|nr:hypothetical protein [Bifidobacteriaceae bacterium]
MRSASAANLSEVSQYRYSNYGSFQNAGWLDYTHFTQASNGEIYYSLDKRKKETDPLFRICHFIATEQDECKDISSEVTSLVTPRPAFNNIAADTNNNIYVSYVNFATLTIVVFKIAVSTLTVVKSWVYNTPGESSVPTIFPQKSFVQNNVLYFSFMYDTVPLINSASYLYIDLNNPNSQIETMPYANCVPGEETCNLKFIDFSVVEINAERAITVLLYSESQGENKKAQISIISNKKIISSYTVSDISGVDDRLVNVFFINENTLVMVNSYNYIHYFNISKNKVITLVKEFKSPLTKIVTADSDNSENIYLDGVLMDSGQEFIYKLSQDGKFTKMQVDPKYYQF